MFMNVPILSRTRLHGDVFNLSTHNKPGVIEINRKLCGITAFLFQQIIGKVNRLFGLGKLILIVLLRITPGD